MNYSKIEGTHITKQTYSDFINNFNYGTQENLGKSYDNSFDMYGYKLESRPGNPWIFLTGSIHGDEWASSYHIKHFLALLLDPIGKTKHVINYKNISRLFNVYVIPVCNPWGFDNATDEQESQYRYTENGVDINRNFDAYWEESEDENKGEEPFSEPETQIIRDKILEIRPVLYLDCHARTDLETMQGFSALPPVNNHYYPFWHNIRETWMTYYQDDFSQGSPAERPTATNWAELQDSRRGRKINVQTLEAGGLQEDMKSTDEREQMKIQLCFFSCYAWIYKSKIKELFLKQ